MSNATENAFLGALLGMAIGDALGAPASGLDREQIAERFGIIDRYYPALSPDREDAQPGEFTDETEFALCIAESMTANRGEFDRETAGYRMVRLASGPSRHWMRDATRNALDVAGETLEFIVRIDEDGLATGDVAARGVPVGLIHAIGQFKPGQLRVDSEAVARVTHGGPAAFNAVAAVAFAIRLAATGVPREDWARSTSDFLGGGQLADALARLDHLRHGRTLEETLLLVGTGLGASESIPASFAAATACESFEDAVFAVVNAGGATDTIGALTGALAGAAGGASSIPQELIDGLEGRISISLAAPWLHKAARQRAGQLIDLRPVHGPRPEMPPRH